MSKTMTQEQIVQLLRSTFQGHDKKAIAESLLAIENMKLAFPLDTIALLFGVLESSCDQPLKTSASIHLKNTIAKFLLVSDNIEPENLDIVVRQITEKLYSLISTAQLAKATKKNLGEALGSICKSNEQLSNAVTTKLFENLENPDSLHLYLGIKWMYLPIFLNQEGGGEMHQFVKTSLLSLKKILTSLFSHISLQENLQQYLTIIEEYFDLVDLVIKHLSQEGDEFALTIQLLCQDQDLQTIFTKYLSIGFQQLGSIVVAPQFSPHYPSLNKIKELILQSIQKLYVRDPVEIISMCIGTVLTCQSNKPDFHVEQLIIRCLELLTKNAQFNTNYPQFSVVFVHLLSKCMVLSKSTADQLSLIEDQPQKFVEVTEDFCDMRQQYSIRMKAASLILTLVRKIDGALIILKMICFDLIRNSYFSKQSNFDLHKTEIFCASRIVKVEVALLTLSLIYSLLKKTADGSMEVRMFMTEMMEQFNGEVEPLIQARIINFVGYCLDMNYLQLVVVRMREEPVVLKHQGFSTLNRILRTGNLQPSVYQYLAGVFQANLETIQTDSYLFQTIVLNNYHKLLLDFPILKQSCVVKLIASMKKMVGTSALVVSQAVHFNTFCSVIELEPDTQFIQQMEGKFCSEVLSVPDRKMSTEYNVLQIMISFLNKMQKTTDGQRQYLTHIQNTMYEYYETRQTFLFMNEYLFFSTSPCSFGSLIEFSSIKMMSKDYFMSPVALILAHLIYKFPLNQPKAIINTALSNYPQSIDRLTKGRLLNIVLMGLITNHGTTLEVLGEEGYLFVITQILEHTDVFLQRIDRKMCALGLMQVLKLSSNGQQALTNVLNSCIKLLGLLYNSGNDVNKVPVYAQHRFQEENEIEEEGQEQNSLRAQDLVPFDSQFYKKFHCSIDSLDEFKSFNQLWPQIKHLYSGQLNPLQVKSLRNILELRKVNEKTRRIVRLKQ